MTPRHRRNAALPVVGLVFGVTAVLFAVTFPGPASSASRPHASPAQTGDRDAEGALLYGRDCAGCHGPEGEGSPRGVPLTSSGEAAAHYMLVTGRMPIEDPEAPIRRSTPRYSDEQLDALVAHVAGFGDGPALPDLDVTEADVAHGGSLYRLHCGQCHGATGLGGALAFEQFAPALRESDPSVVAAAMTVGPGAMPSFTGLDFTESELVSVVAYVQELRDPVDRGGLPISRWGRSSEGLFVWIVVVPALVVMAAWLARRVR